MRQNPRCIFRALAGLLLEPLEGMARGSKTLRSRPMTERRAPLLLVVLTVLSPHLDTSCIRTDTGSRGGVPGAHRLPAGSRTLRVRTPQTRRALQPHARRLPAASHGAVAQAGMALAKALDSIQ